MVAQLLLSSYVRKLSDHFIQIWIKAIQIPTECQLQLKNIRVGPVCHQTDRTLPGSNLSNGSRWLSLKAPLPLLKHFRPCHCVLLYRINILKVMSSKINLTRVSSRITHLPLYTCFSNGISFAFKIHFNASTCCSLNGSWLSITSIYCLNEVKFTI